MNARIESNLASAQAAWNESDLASKSWRLGKCRDCEWSAWNFGSSNPPELSMEILLMPHEYPPGLWKCCSTPCHSWVRIPPLLTPSGHKHEELIDWSPMICPQVCSLAGYMPGTGSANYAPPSENGRHPPTWPHAPSCVTALWLVNFRSRVCLFGHSSELVLPCDPSCSY